MEAISVVIGTIGTDCHVWGTRVISYALEKAGFKVIYLGAMCSQEEFINAAIEGDAKAILVSSMCGHGVLDCEGLRGKCDEAGLSDILLYVGGYLVVARQDQEWQSIERDYREKGFDRVYPPETLPETAIADLKGDLVKRGMIAKI